MRALIATTATSATLILAALFFTLSARGAEREPPANTTVLKPATRYNGSTPTDLSNGVLFNNGTYGVRNEDYEAWAKSATVVAGLSERPYAFTQKTQFMNVMNEQVQWGEAAIANWKSTTNEFPDALAYSKTAIETMSPALDKLKSTTSSANSAGESGWTSAETNARRALIDFRIAYMQMHKNVQARALK